MVVSRVKAGIKGLDGAVGGVAEAMFALSKQELALTYSSPQTFWDISMLCSMFAKRVLSHREFDYIKAV